MKFPHCVTKTRAYLIIIFKKNQLCTLFSIYVDEDKIHKS